MPEEHRKRRSWSAAAETVLGPDGLVACDACSLGVACFAAERLWYKVKFPPAAWIAAALVWVSVTAACRAWASFHGGRSIRFRPRLAPFLATALCSLALSLFARPCTPEQAYAFFALLAALLAFNRAVLALMSRAAATGPWDGARLGFAQLAALFAVHPYVRSGLVGAGDASSYSLAVADYVEQWRAGIFPVLVGQSHFAFSGGFQPLRNAPTFTHLAWAFDLLGFHTFNAFALQNLTVLACMLGAMLGCCAALRFIIPDSPWAGLLLSALFGLCPGVLAPLYGGDMYVTFMVLPFIPWLVLGIERSSASPDKIWPWLLQSSALAAMWLAHPPVAMWASFVAGIAGLAILLRERRCRILAGMAAAAALFVVLTGYLFASVLSLDLPKVPRAEALGSVGYKLSVLRDAWGQSLLPVSHGGNNLIGDIQLGYGLLLCLLLSLAITLGTKEGRILLLCCATILAYAWPIPVLTKWAWLSLPSEMLVITNQWPVERFYVLLAGFSVFVIAVAIRRLRSVGSLFNRACVMLLACACAWSLAESRKFFHRAEATSLPETLSENSHLQENIVVSRTHSYEYLGTPSYFSNGHMDPRLETRLVDAATMQVFADGSTLRSGADEAKHPSRTLTIRRQAGQWRSDALEVRPGQSLALNFDFLGQNPAGELDVSGGSLSQYYSLPRSGGPRAFGSGPEASHRLIVENSTSEAENVTLEFKGAAIGDLVARVDARPVDDRDAEVDVVSLTPFHAVVFPDRDCYIETPKLFIPGYAAFVDGRSAPVVRSSEGLVALRLSRGRHDVVLTYSGSAALRWSYFGTAAAWLGLAAALGMYVARGERLLAPPAAHARRAASALRSAVSGRPGRAAAAIGLAAVLAIGTFLARGTQYGPSRATIRISLQLPYPKIGLSEPLLTTGRSGAGDFIYVTYVDGSHVSVGHDKWGYGGAKSPPISVDYSKQQTVEIGISSLVQNPHDASRGDARALHPTSLFVDWNGARVLSETDAAYPSTPSEVAVGSNSIGGGTTGPRFSGTVESVSRGGADGSR